MPYKDPEKAREANRRSFQKYKDERHVQHKIYYEANKDMLSEKHKEWKNEHPEYMVEYGKNHYAKNKDRVLAMQKTRNLEKYGLTLEQYNYLVVSQDNKCKICGRVMDGHSEPQIDHKHDGTRNTRGLLCCRCNMGLGLFGDSPETLGTAIDYLEGYNGNKSLVYFE